MDYIELNAARMLRFAGGQIAFRDPASAGPGNIAQFNVSNANAGVKIWNVTDPLNPKRVSTNLNGSSLTFKLPTDSILEFVSQQASHARPGERLIGSTEVLESIIGKYKRLQSMHSKGGMTGRPEKGQERGQNYLCLTGRHSRVPRPLAWVLAGGVAIVFSPNK